MVLTLSDTGSISSDSSILSGASVINNGDAPANSITPDLIEELNESLFHDCARDSSSFPLVVRFETADSAEWSRVHAFIASVDPALVPPIDPNTSSLPSLDITCNDSSKASVEVLIYKLYEHNATHEDSQIGFDLDYANFLSHPGILFIKKLSHSLVNPTDQNSYTLTKEDTKAYEHDLFVLLQEMSHFDSVRELKIFTNHGDTVGSTSAANLSSFAIVKFDIYIDVDIVISKLNRYTPNPFNVNKSIPLYLNKYLNKKERSNSRSSLSVPPSIYSSKPPSPGNGPANNSNFDVIFVDNLTKFFGDEVSTDDVLDLLNKFEEFGNEVESIYLPIEGDSESVFSDTASNSPQPTYKLLEYGFVRFKQSTNVTENTLKILYYLNNLTFESYKKFDPHAVTPLFLDGTKEEPKLKNSIKVTIAQFKHNHFIYKDSNSNFLTFDEKNNGCEKITVSYPNPGFITTMASKQVNYQETNIYVNNLPVAFGNNDALWESFWKQFGSIKSAKIINPQYYRNDDSTENQNDSNSHSVPKKFNKSGGFGKIGFVFYTDFKMAVKAILLTNNRVINLHGSSSPILISSSFALQKPNANSHSGSHFPLSAGAQGKQWSPVTATGPSKSSSSHKNANANQNQQRQFNYPTNLLPVPGQPIPPPTAANAAQYYNPYYFGGGPFFYPSPPHQQPPIAFGAPPFFGAPIGHRNSNGQNGSDYEEPSSMGGGSYTYSTMGYPFPYSPLPPGYFYDGSYEAYEDKRND